MTRSVILALLVPSVLPAQSFPRPKEIGRTIEAEVSASLFFGNTRQMLAATRAAAGKVDSAYEVRAEGRFDYGQATDDEDDIFVSRRSWLGSLSYDYRPFGMTSPFVLATVESSLERRIDLRYSAGAGAKRVLIRDDRTLADISLALLGERSHLPDRDAGRITTTLARWSTRARARHAFSDRISLESITFYRPEVDAFDEFTLSSITSLGVQVSERITLRLSFTDNYDSEARQRGARSNNDGVLVVGVLTRM